MRIPKSNSSTIDALDFCFLISTSVRRILVVWTRSACSLYASLQSFMVASSWNSARMNFPLGSTSTFPCMNHRPRLEEQTLAADLVVLLAQGGKNLALLLGRKPSVFPLSAYDAGLGVPDAA